MKQAGQWIPVLKGETIGENFRKVFAPVKARYVRLAILDAISAPQLPATLYDCNSHMVAFPGPSIWEFQVLADQRQEQPHAVAVDAEPGRETVAIGRAAIGGRVAPRAAAKHARRDGLWPGGSIGGDSL